MTQGAAVPAPEPASRKVSYDDVSAALRVWVDRHPYPDEPVRLSLGDRPLSPRELVQEVEKRTPTGREFVDSFKRLAELRPDVGMRGILDRLRGANSDAHRMGRRFTLDI